MRKICKVENSISFIVFPASLHIFYTSHTPTISESASELWPSLVWYTIYAPVYRLLILNAPLLWRQITLLSRTHVLYRAAKKLCQPSSEFKYIAFVSLHKVKEAKEKFR